MDYLLTDEGLRDLMILFLIGCGLVVAVVGFMRYCRITDEQWKLDNPLDTDPAPAPKLYPIDPTNIDQVLALHGVEGKDRADIVKGTSL